MKARPGPPARADGVWALVPFKAAGAKRRLTALLSADERQGLARAMLRDVLAALSACPDLDGVLLVSRDADAPALAGEFGARVFADSAADLSGAVTEAGAFAARLPPATGRAVARASQWRGRASTPTPPDVP